MAVHGEGAPSYSKWANWVANFISMDTNPSKMTQGWGMPADSTEPQTVTHAEALIMGVYCKKVNEISAEVKISQGSVFFAIVYKVLPISISQNLSPDQQQAAGFMPQDFWTVEHRSSRLSLVC